VPSSSIYQDTLRQVTAYFTSAGSAPADAQRQAIAWLGNEVQTQAALLSYIDVFWVFAIAAALMVLVALVLLRSIKLRAELPAAH
jgi:DHA2 family multidrug resistance protein